jgi:integrase
MLDPVILDLLKRTREQQLERRNHYGTLHVRNFIDRYGYLNQNGDGEEMEFLMVREDGSFLHRTVIDYASKVIKRELGQQQFDFHSLRHTHAAELSEYGVNLKEIQRRLGHKTLEVTVRTYLHATDVMEAESMQIMKQMYGTT